MIYINMKLVFSIHGVHVFMPACIRYNIIAFIVLCFCSLPLYKAAHVANKVVYIKNYKVI